MFPAVSLVAIVPVLFLGLLGHDSLPELLVGGFFLGVAGTAFAVGVPFVSAWFPPVLNWGRPQDAAETTVFTPHHLNSIEEDIYARLARRVAKVGAA